MVKSKLAKTEFNRALHLFPPKKSDWTPKATTCSSITHDGISEVWKEITKYEKQTKGSDYFFEKRREQNQYWLLETINERLKSHFYTNPEIKKALEKNKKAVQNDEISPFAAAQIILGKYFK